MINELMEMVEFCEQSGVAPSSLHPACRTFNRGFMMEAYLDGTRLVELKVVNNTRHTGRKFVVSNAAAFPQVNVEPWLEKVRPPEIPDELRKDKSDEAAQRRADILKKWLNFDGWADKLTVPAGKALKSCRGVLDELPDSGYKQLAERVAKLEASDLATFLADNLAQTLPNLPEYELRQFVDWLCKPTGKIGLLFVPAEDPLLVQTLRGVEEVSRNIKAMVKEDGEKDFWGGVGDLVNLTVQIRPILTMPAPVSSRADDYPALYRYKDNHVLRVRESTATRIMSTLEYMLADERKFDPETGHGMWQPITIGNRTVSMVGVGQIEKVECIHKLFAGFVPEERRFSLELLSSELLTGDPGSLLTFVCFESPSKAAIRCSETLKMTAQSWSQAIKAWEKDLVPARQTLGNHGLKGTPLTPGHFLRLVKKRIILSRGTPKEMECFPAFTGSAGDLLLGKVSLGTLKKLLGSVSDSALTLYGTCRASGEKVPGILFWYLAPWVCYLHLIAKRNNTPVNTEDQSYKMGQFLALNDALYAHWKKSTGGNLPNRDLPGSSMLATAKTNPARAVQVLSSRMSPAYAWISRVRNSPNEKSKPEVYGLSTLKRINALNFDVNEIKAGIDHELNLTMGFLADPFSKEKEEEAPDNT